MLTQTIDLYCERTGPEFWSEPVNAATNLLFLVAAWAAWRYAKRLGGTACPSVVILIALLASIGIGSGLFHTFATGWAMVLDVVPILLFELVYLWAYYRRVAGWKPVWVWAILGVFIAASLFAGQFRAYLNGSLSYAPSFIVLLATGIYHHLAKRRARGVLTAAALLFLVSLSFRTLDTYVCGAVPLGTHFLWHTFNASVLYLLMRALLANVRPISSFRL